MAPNINKAAASAVIGIYRLLLFVFIIGFLYFGKSLLIPLALAALFTFLLAPLITLLERWLTRTLSILIVIMIFIMSVGIVGYILTNEFVEFSTNLPNYRVNIENKLNSLNIQQNSTFTQIFDTLEKVKEHFPGQNIEALPKSHNKMTSVNVIESSTSADITSIIKNFIATFLYFLGSTGLVFLLVIFMLFTREDIRGRFIQLIGPRRISATTRAMNDAGQRVAHYLLMHLFLNVVFGIIISFGLYFIGVPNAILWGGLTAILRFIPFVGVLIAAFFPFIVTLAVSESWTMPLLTIALFVLLDLVTVNIIEPLVASARIGISPLALIVSAIFWTILWGPVGLLLSTPLTVCLIVMGRHIPKMAFLHVLLSNEEGLSLYEECYQRLISLELTEVMVLVNNYIKTNPPTSLFDSVFIPILSVAETDHREELLDDDQLAFLHQNILDILDEIRHHTAPIPIASDAKIESDSLPGYNILCVTTSTERNELAVGMLVQILTDLNFNSERVSIKLHHEGISANIKEGHYDAVIISVVAPYSIVQIRNLCAYLHQQFPSLKIIVGLWGGAENNAVIEKRLQISGAYTVVISLAQAVEHLDKFRETKLKSE